MSTICAIIPTYNRAEMLKASIRSVLAQSRAPDEVIIVDDGSTDQTESIVLAFGNKLRYIKKANGGKSEALNVALESTRCDYIWIMDDDDLAEPNGLAQLESALNTAPSAGFVFGSYRIFYGAAVDDLYVPLSEQFPRQINTRLALLEDMFVVQPAMLVKRAAYNDVGPFNTRFIRSQDYEMTLRLIKQFEAVGISDVIFRQRQHDGQRGSLKFSIDAGNRTEAWYAFDRDIFTWVRNNFDLADFVPDWASSGENEWRKSFALVERAGIFAKRGLWDYVEEDISELAALQERHLSEPEREFLVRIVNHDLPWIDLARSSNLIGSFRNFAAANRTVRDFFEMLSKHLGWSIRRLLLKGQYRQALNLLSMGFNLRGLGFAAELLPARFRN